MISQTHEPNIEAKNEITKQKNIELIMSGNGPKIREIIPKR